MLRSFRAVAALAAFAVLALVRPAAADLAVLIVNQTYERAPDFGDLSGQANRLARAYEDAGYDVLYGLDLDGRAMQELLGEVERHGGGEDARLIVHFIGHTLRDGGVVWLAPVDANPDRIVDTAFSAPTVRLLNRLAQRFDGGAAILVGTRATGLPEDAVLKSNVRQLRVGNGVLAVLGRPRPLSDLVVEELLAPDAELTLDDLPDGLEAFGGLEDGVTLALREGGGPSDATRAARRAWREAEAEDTAEAYAAYLEAHRWGRFAPEALARIAAVDAGQPPPAQQQRRRGDDDDEDDDGDDDDEARTRTPGRNDDSARQQPRRQPERTDAAAIEQRMNLDAAARRRVQRDLVELGYNTRGVDGVFGPGTRNALRSWQRTVGLPVTGHLTWDSRRRLREMADASRAERPRRQPNRTVTRNQTELVNQRWRQAYQENTIASYERFLRQHPNAGQAPAARRRIDELRRQQQVRQRRAQWVAAERQLGLSYDQRFLVEQVLARRGYRPGAVDGHFNNGTRGALRRFQSAHGWPVTGYVTDPYIYNRLYALR
ncbi:MAG: peptidoglycan-binding protein [Pseudomonadota bacterium]